MGLAKEKWIWMPHAGHFIGGHQCQFRMNTYVGKYIVSTVGELWWDNQEVRRIHAKIHDPAWYADNDDKRGDAFDYAYKDRFGFTDVGFDRTYETMVFKAKKSKHECCPYGIVVKNQVDFEGYKTAKDAYKGHLKLCEKWAKEK